MNMIISPHAHKLALARARKAKWVEKMRLIEARDELRKAEAAAIHKAWLRKRADEYNAWYRLTFPGHGIV